MILKGGILITTNKDFVLQTLYNLPDIKIISLSEENDLGIDPRLIISGSILLPPVDAVIAEIDGNEEKYNMIYSAHLSSPVVKEYMSSILAYLYKGGKIVLYYPNTEYNNTMKKMLYFIMVMYGIHIGIINDPDIDNASCYFDANLEYIQLDLIYFYTGIIDWREYLYYYPINYPISDQIMNILLNQIRPYGRTLNEQLQVIQRLRVGIKEKPDLKSPISLVTGGE